MSTPVIQLVEHDLPAAAAAHLARQPMVAIDTETTGLSLQTDQLCLCQLGDGLGNVWLVKFPILTDSKPDYLAPNLRALLQNPSLTKLFHYARFDLAMLQHHLGLPPIENLFCTKIASKLARPTAGKHNLRALCHDYLGIELDKTEQLSNWAAPVLSQSQQAYAAADVLYLHQLHGHLLEALKNNGNLPFLAPALAWLPTRVAMDLADLLPESDLFSHH